MNKQQVMDALRPHVRRVYDVTEEGDHEFVIALFRDQDTEVACLGTLHRTVEGALAGLEKSRQEWTSSEHSFELYSILD